MMVIMVMLYNILSVVNKKQIVYLRDLKNNMLFYGALHDLENKYLSIGVVGVLIPPATKYNMEIILFYEKDDENGENKNANSV